MYMQIWYDYSYDLYAMRMLPQKNTISLVPLLFYLIRLPVYLLQSLLHQDSLSPPSLHKTRDPYHPPPTHPPTVTIKSAGCSTSPHRL
mmetsp:Transcript_3907/g.7439  ORF Transcript_3907/g.7439 Transcript_3907/m.7439 type:complete len:88 (+) Transcript_3907:5181-5444(+)